MNNLPIVHQQLRNQKVCAYAFSVYLPKSTVSEYIRIDGTGYRKGHKRITSVVNHSTNTAL